MLKRSLLSLAVCAASTSSIAYAGPVSLDDQQLADVQGQAGLEIDIGGVGPTATQVSLGMDQGVPSCAGLGAACDEALVYKNLAISGATGPLQPIHSTIDVGATGLGNTPYVRVTSEWDDLRFRIGQSTLAGLPNNSIGEWAFDSTGSLEYYNHGLFSATNNNAYINLTSQGEIYYRQSQTLGSPELSLGAFNLGFRFTDATHLNPGFGKVGLDSASGLQISAPYMNFDLNFDILFNQNPSAVFSSAGRRSMLLFGWEGGIKNAVLQASGGGLGYGQGKNTAIDPTGTYDFFNATGGLNTGSGITPRSQGLNVLAQWDYDADFAWILGEASGNKTQVRFTNWQRMGAGTAGAGAYDFRMPITIDAIKGGQGPGGICYGGNIFTSGSLANVASGCAAVGGTNLNVSPESAAMAVMIRDGRLHAYNTKVDVRDPGGAIPSEIFNWGLVYTFGKLDANIFLYPKGYDGVAETTTGLKADISFATQSPGYWRAAKANFNRFATLQDAGADLNSDDRWATNTHFLLADTSTAIDITGDGTAGDQFGIGVLNADLLWRADNLYVRLVNDANFPGIWLHAPTGMRYNFRGLFGGGNMKNLLNPVRLFLLDINLSTNNFIFNLQPPNVGEAYLGFAGLLDFDGTAYLAMAEPSSPTAEFRLDGVSGRLMWDKGRVDVRSSVENADGKPSLSITNDLLVGSTALSGNPFIGTVKFGGGLPNNGDGSYGRIAIPSGRWASEISLKK